MVNTDTINIIVNNVLEFAVSGLDRLRTINLGNSTTLLTQYATKGFPFYGVLLTYANSDIFEFGPAS